MWELCVKFCFGQSEDYSLWYSLSSSSEELHWRGVCVVVSVYVICWGGCAVKHTFRQSLAASHEEQMCLNDFSSFLGMRRYKKMGSWNLLWKYFFEVLFCQISQSTEGLIPDLHFDLLAGCVESQWGQRLHPCSPRWQGTLFSWLSQSGILDSNSYLFYLLYARSLFGPWELLQGHVMIWGTIWSHLCFCRWGIKAKRAGKTWSRLL